MRVEIPKVDYWKQQIKCQSACPVHTDARGYVRAIAQGDYEKAYMIARAPNPLASICGRICGAPCEAACRRGDLDEAVSIRALKRFATEKFGAESGRFDSAPIDLVRRLVDAGEGECEELEDIKHFLGRFRRQITDGFDDDAKTVGIIGSGPAGLAAAHDLCLMGIRPTIYEMESVPAGMLYLGVPEYRLPRDLIEAEVEVIKAMGTDIRCNVTIGEDVTLAELREQHDAVLISVGAKKSRLIPIPNVDAPGVIGGVDFLRDVALHNDVELGQKVLVIGGGNVAYDVARTAVRQPVHDYDVSRTALRQEGVIEVHLACLESRAEMPADDAEIEEGDEEGIIRHNSWGPKEILLDDFGRARGVRFTKCLGVFDEEGRFAPKFDEDQTLDIEADQVLLSIGQATDLTFIDSDDVALNERGQLALDERRNITEAEDVFAAGDVATGPGLMIHAIASGKQAARRIHAFLTQDELQSTTRVTMHHELPMYGREVGYEALPREGVPVMSAAERGRSMEAVVERGFDEERATRQAARCLDCGINTIFNSERCILCGGCVDVCPEACLAIVGLDQIEGEPELEQVVANRYGSMPLELGAALIKDETVCIRCGLCAVRCPVDAITMESFNFKEAFSG